MSSIKIPAKKRIFRILKIFSKFSQQMCCKNFLFSSILRGSFHLIGINFLNKSLNTFAYNQGDSTNERELHKNSGIFYMNEHNYKS